MNEQLLLQTASKLKQVNSNTAEEYSNKSLQIISRMNKLMETRADIIDLVGKKNISMMKDNHANHVRFIASILKNYNSQVFVETVLWVFRAYRSKGFNVNYWPALLNGFIEILKEILTNEAYNEIYKYYEWMQINIPIFIKISDQSIKNE